ncbi:MAG TPA: class I SAM-dependent methyltransferase [Acidimicrobiales bacterium]
MRRDAGALRRTFASYEGAPRITRALVAARLAIAPLRPLERETRSLHGRMLSLGSGISAIERYLVECNPVLEIEGIDLDPRRVELISSTRQRCPRVTLRQGDATKIDEPPVYAGVLVCDAMHHFDPEYHKPLVRAIANCLVPGGVCIVKDLDVRPRWKYEWNRLHDRVVAGPEPIHCQPAECMADLLAGAGLIPERVERTDRRWEPYAHYLVRARKP